MSFVRRETVPHTPCHTTPRRVKSKSLLHFPYSVLGAPTLSSLSRYFLVISGCRKDEARK